MIKSITAKLSILFLLTAITTCYYEREINEELEICFVRGGNIWIMDMDGSNQRPITNSTLDTVPSWSPDGKKILFQRGTTTLNVFIVNSDGSNLKQITSYSSPFLIQSPTWSADGEMIFYYEENSSEYKIVSAKPDGTILNKFATTERTSSLSPSPDGKYVYYCDNSSGTRKIFRMDVNSGLSIVITTNPSFFTQLSVSPDGRSIAYVLQTNPIYILNVMTGTFFYLVSGESFCWTPDGKTIIYTNGNNIYRTNIDLTDNKQLSFTNDCSSPCVKWKPK